MIGVLLMAYGSPQSLDDLTEYYTHIRGGQRPSPQMLEELASRYRAIGGRSPLHEVTGRQAAALQARLDAVDKGRYRVYVGMRHAPPFVADAVAEMAADGIAAGVGLVLAPHYSRMSIGAYIGAAEDARRSLPAAPALHYVERWGDHPLFLDALADRLRDALASQAEEERLRTHVIFTAHSLPERILSWGDPYPDELRRTAAGVADRAGIGRWTFAYQSAGRTAEQWLGPEVLETIRRLSGEGVPCVAVCPVGFVADHMEVLYDLEIEARDLAERLGVRFVRAASLNDHPLLIAALADLVQQYAPAIPA